MTIVVGSPVPADKLDQLGPLLAAVPMQRQTRGAYSHFPIVKKPGGSLYMLQWRSRYFYFMSIVSQIQFHGGGLLTM